MTDAKLVVKLREKLASAERRIMRLEAELTVARQNNVGIALIADVNTRLQTVERTLEALRGTPSVEVVPGS